MSAILTVCTQPPIVTRNSSDLRGCSVSNEGHQHIDSRKGYPVRPTWSWREINSSSKQLQTLQKEYSTRYIDSQLKKGPLIALRSLISNNGQIEEGQDQGMSATAAKYLRSITDIIICVPPCDEAASDGEFSIKTTSGSPFLFCFLCCLGSTA